MSTWNGSWGSSQSSCTPGVGVIMTGTKTFNTVNTNMANVTTKVDLDLCSVMGHEVAEEPVRYSDGLLAMYCSRCNERITIERIPAGDIPSRVRGLLVELMESDLIPMKAIEDVRAELVLLEEQVVTARDLITVLDSLLAKKIRDLDA